MDGIAVISGFRFDVDTASSGSKCGENVSKYHTVIRLIVDVVCDQRYGIVYDADDDNISGFCKWINFVVIFYIGGLSLICGCSHALFVTCGIWAGSL